MPAFKYLQQRRERRTEICARMRAAKAQKRLAAVLPQVAEVAPSVIVLRGPAFCGVHVIQLETRGTDRRGWRLVVDGQPAGLLACGAVVRILQCLKKSKV